MFFSQCCVCVHQAEETKVLRLQLELSQTKGDLERRIQEKEEEMEAVRYRAVTQQGSLFDLHTILTLSINHST